MFAWFSGWIGVAEFVVLEVFVWLVLWFVFWLLVVFVVLVVLVWFEGKVLFEPEVEFVLFDEFVVDEFEDTLEIGEGGIVLFGGGSQSPLMLNI